MSWMQTAWTGQTEVIGILVIGFFLLFLWNIFLQIRSSRMKRQLRRLTRGTKKENIEQLLVRYAGDVEGALGQVQTLSERVANLTATANGMKDQVMMEPGIVRFNAFDQTGSDLSFAAAFVNQHGDGLVFSSIYGRDESRVYAKPLRRGESKYVLTQEEKQAIEQALSRVRTNTDRSSK